MRFLRNLLAVIGLVTIVAAAWAFLGVGANIGSFDPEARQTYQRLVRRLVATGSAAEATVVRRQADPALSFEDVERAIKSNQIRLGIADLEVDHLGPDGAPAAAGRWRRIASYTACNEAAVSRMIAFNDAFAAHLPCRVVLMEDEQGAVTLVSVDMDFMIYGGWPLPLTLADDARELHEGVTSLMDRAARGEP